MPLAALFAWLTVQSMAVFRSLAAPVRAAGVAGCRAPCAGPDMSAWLVQVCPPWWPAMPVRWSTNHR